MATTVPFASHIDIDIVSKLLEDVNKQVTAFRSGETRAREGAISSAQALALALETPGEAIVRLTWNEVSPM